MPSGAPISTAAGTTDTGTASIGAGDDRYAIFCVSQEGTGVVQPTGATWGGRTLTHIVGINTSDTNGRVDMYGLNESEIAQASDTTLSFTLDPEPGGPAITWHMTCYQHVDQTDPTGSTDSVGGSTENPLTGCDVPCATGNRVVAFAMTGEAATASWAAPLTERTDQAGSSSAGSVADGLIYPTSQSALCTWTVQNFRACVYVIELAHAIGSTVAILDTPTSAQGSSHTFTVSAGSNRGLIIAFQQETTSAPTGCTYGTVACQLVGTETSTDGNLLMTYFFASESVIAAAASTAIAFSGGSYAEGSCTTHAASYSGVHQGVPVVRQIGVGAGDTPNPVTGATIAGATGNLLVAFSGTGDGATASWAAPYTERTDETASGGSSAGSLADYPIVAANIASLCTWVTQNRAATVGVELNSAPATVVSSMGQSNDSGRGAEAAYSPTGNVWLFHNDGTLDALADPWDDNTNQEFSVSSETVAEGNSYAPRLADYLEANLGTSVIMIPNAKGGSSAANWQPASVVTDTTTLLGAMLVRTARVLTQFSTPTTLRIVIYQGETDAQDPGNAAAWKSNWDTVCSTVVTALPGVTVQFFIVKLPVDEPAAAGYDDWEVVRTQQQLLYTSRSDAYIVQAPVADLDSGVHLDTGTDDTEGQRKLAVDLGAEMVNPTASVSASTPVTRVVSRRFGLRRSLR